MPDKENNIILYSDNYGKISVNVRFVDEKSNCKCFFDSSTYKQLL